MHKLNILDIETACDKEAALKLLSKFDPSEVKTGNLKDPDKISAKLAEAEASHKSDFLEESALYAERGKIVAIGWLIDGDEPVTHAASEEMMLNIIWTAIASALLDNDKIVGHNLLQFDLCYMMRRSWILGVPIPANVRTKFRGRYYWHENFIDTCSFWKLDQRDYKGNLDYVAKALGVGAKNGNGKDFAELLIKDREAALDYLRNDLRMTMAVAKRMGV